ncbi:MAG: MlaD family protein, partial [Sphingobacteriaceae bacterium]
MKISNETKVGSLTVIAITVLIIGYNFLKGKDLFTNTVDYYAKYENINGIKVSNAILYNGFNVGKVTALDLNENGEVIATLTLQPNVKIPINSIAKIASQDLLGAKAIVLLFSDARTYYQEGDTLQTEVEMSLSESVNTQVLPVKAKAEKLLGTMDSILITVQTILNPNFRNNIDESFSSIKRSIETLEKTATRIDTLVKFQSARFA